MIPEQLARAVRKASLTRADVRSLARSALSTVIPAKDLLVGALLASCALVAVGALSWKWGAALALAAAGLVAGSGFRRGSASAGAAPGGADESSLRLPRLDGAELQALLAGLPDAAIVLDRAGCIVAANDLALALFPVLPGRHISQATRVPQLLSATDTALRRGEAQSLVVQLTPPHDQSLATRLTPIDADVSAGGRLVLVVLRDMTGEEQLARMRADFVANASHELRTPLASLKGFVETLQGAAKDDPRAREQFLAIMHEQASRMSRLIEDLLSLSRIEMHEHLAPRASVDLAAIVDDAALALGPVAATAGITIDTAGMQRPGLVVGDREELAQVVHNLVQNAIKYGREGGSVSVTLARDGVRMALAVRDDGIGIAPEHLPRLTERFYRVSAKESRERGGTGLGLAIVKHIVNRHRGELGIESRLGQGSTFTVRLPAATRA